VAIAVRICHLKYLYGTYLFCALNQLLLEVHVDIFLLRDAGLILELEEVLHLALAAEVPTILFDGHIDCRFR
jgi:hypothetical protein